MSIYENQEFQIKPKSQKEPGFPQQKAIKNAEISEKDLEHLEHYVDDLQKIRETLEETREEREHLVGHYVVYEKVYERACLEFSKLPKMPEYLLEEIVNSFLEKTKKVLRHKLDNTLETGAMLSAICNESVKQYTKQETEKGTKYEDIKPLTVNIKETDTSFIDLGFRNADKLNLNIKGDINTVFGTEMEGGKITIEGNAREPGRRMKGGEIIIKGDAEDNVGHRMEGGKITVEGNAKRYIGPEMEGGKITIEGNAREPGRRMKGGEIIIKGDAERVIPISDEKYGRTGGEIIVGGKSV